MNPRELMVQSAKAYPVSRAYLVHPPECPLAARPKMTSCRPKLALARGTARLALTCVRPLPALPVDRPD
jgi:hypothetical protein